MGHSRHIPSNRTAPARTIRGWIMNHFILVLLACATVLRAAQVRVPQDYPSIEAGLAVVVDGDTLVLAHGTYAEHALVCNQSITLLGDPLDPAAVLIDGDRHGRILEFQEVQQAVVRGITFRGGDALIAEPALGGAILGTGGQVLRIRDCRFLDCHAGQGGAVAVLDADTRIEDCLFEDCRGSAVYNLGTPLQVLGCVFRGNRGVLGAAVRHTEGGFLLVDNCLFHDNLADSLGGALYNERDLYVQFSTFLRNRALTGGDLHCYYGDVRSCTFVDSRAERGTAIRFFADLTLEESVMAHGRGEGVVLRESPFNNGHLWAQCCNLFNNTGPDFVNILNSVYPAVLLAEDPLFCDPENNDVRLAPGSPCLPGYNACGLPLGSAGIGPCEGPAVHPEFEPTLEFVLTGHEMEFRDLSTGDPDHWRWDLDGDGTIDSQEQHPVHVYGQPGVFDVTLIVGNPFHTDTLTIGNCVTARTARVLRVPEDLPGVAEALAACQWGDTVDVACGSWPATVLSIPSGVTLRSRTGHPECATLQGDGIHRVIQCFHADSLSAVLGFRITGGAATGTSLEGMGGGILLQNSSTLFRDCIIEGNQARYGGGVFSAGTVVGRFHNCTLADNSALSNGSAIGSLQLGATFRNCLVTANPGHPAVYGSGRFLCSDIHGNPGGDWTGMIAGQDVQDGNFSLDPLVCPDPPGVYRLQDDSPCFTAACGTVGGNRLNCAGVAVQEPQLPPGFALLAAYPNPFNGATRIRYRAPGPGPVGFRLLDIRGRRVHSWQALAAPGLNETRLSGEGLASGVYFVETVGAGPRGTLKVLLVK
jgi:PKD repeat protein